MTEPEIVEDFYGVYLLYCINPKYKGRTYIGYTRDPNRRIIQHNRGTWAGGAYRTSKRGPWKMVMIVHGFPNNISALRFEWAWQNPGKTTRLQHLGLFKNGRKETVFQFKLRVLSEMLRVGPWCRLPLVIRWLENDFREEFPEERMPPEHMIICQGPVKSRNLRNTTNTSSPDIICRLCSGRLKASEQLSCPNSNCDLVAHITCLADKMLPPGEYIPIDGKCPLCYLKLKWGDLIRKMKGCLDADINDVLSQNKVLEDCGNFVNYDVMESSNDDDVYTQDDLSLRASDSLNGDIRDSDGENEDQDVIRIPTHVLDEPSWFTDCQDDIINM
ncbi:structure-specific endonuclease subunit SLX1 homolog isoform X1 [Danaus plexippus]|uniref:structure-specific endonuclease subunit SLX1 homolog isoform X1 n=1 Tax=Danaus plexippus TaxID=13037 RepID=UPI002AB0ED8A|nr:structure-specific endonuclease subunit SLX1 homolog isoform X1 [Danaus plexippus]